MTSRALALCALVACCGANAAAQVRSAADLAPVWALPDGGARPADADARYVVFHTDGDRDVSVVDVETGAIVFRASGLEPPGPSADARATMPRLAAPGLLVFFRDRGEIEAVELPDGRTRWRVALPDGAFELPWMRAVGGVLAIHAQRSDGSIAFHGLDVADGRWRWQRAYAASMAMRFGADEGRLYALSPRASTSDPAASLVAIDARTGGERWRRALPDCSGEPRALAGRVVIACTTRSVMLDAATGRDAGAHPGSVVGVVSPSRVLVRDLRARRWQLALAEVGSGTALWRSASEPGAIWIGSDAIYTCDASGARALELASGALLWSLGAECDVVLARGTARGDVLVIGAQAYARSDRPMPSERAVFSGRVILDGRPLQGVVVRVGSVLVRTDRAGRYRAAIEARGIVRVEAEWSDLRRRTARPCVYQDPGNIRIDGSARYRFDVRATSGRTCNE